MIGPGHTAEEEFTARMHVVLDTLEVQADRLLGLLETLHGLADDLLKMAEEMPPEAT